MTRAQVLSVRERDYVIAAQALGAGSLRTILQHVWPNVTAPIIVQATLLIGGAIITEASLSFLGVGVQPPTPSWGSMLQTGYQYMQVAPRLSIFPGVAIFLTVLAFNFLGMGSGSPWIRALPDAAKQFSFRTSIRTIGEAQ